jgi:large subunit ribosomal protein L5
MEKIVLSRGVGAAVSDKKLIDYAVDELTKITGQKRYHNSKKDVASFKLKGCRLVRRLLYVEKECMSF